MESGGGGGEERKESLEARAGFEGLWRQLWCLSCGIEWRLPTSSPLLPPFLRSLLLFLPPPPSPFCLSAPSLSSSLSHFTSSIQLAEVFFVMFSVMWTSDQALRN